MPVARVQRPTEPAGETADAPPFGIRLYKAVPLPYFKGTDYSFCPLTGGGRGWAGARPEQGGRRDQGAGRLAPQANIIPPQRTRRQARGASFIKLPHRAAGGLPLRALGLEDQQALDAVFEEGGKLPPELVPALAVNLQLLAEGVWDVVGHVDLLGGDPRLL